MSYRAQTHIEIFDFMRGITVVNSMAIYLCASERVLFYCKNHCQIDGCDGDTIKKRFGFKAIKPNFQSTRKKH